MQETVRFGSIDRFAFYTRRALRLWPALFLVLAFCAAVALRSKNPRVGLAAVAVSGLYLMNWNRAFDLFPSIGLSHTWSLATEEQFYLLWPFLLAFFLPRRPLAWTAALVLAVVTLRVAMVADGYSVARTYNGFDTHSDGLLIGSGLAMLNANGRLFYWLVRCAPLGVPAAAVLLAMPPELAFAEAFGLTLTALTSTALIVLAIGSAPVRWALSLSVPRYVGKISYGLYLWHPPLFSLGHHLPNFPGLTFVLVLAAFVISAASYHLVERPCLRLKGKFSRAERMRSAEAELKPLIAVKAG